MENETYLGNPLPSGPIEAQAEDGAGFVNKEAMGWRLAAIDNDRFTLSRRELDELHSAWLRVFKRRGTLEAEKQIKAMVGTQSVGNIGAKDASIGFDMGPMCRIWAETEWSDNVPKQLRPLRKNFMEWVAAAAKYVAGYGFVWVDELNLWYKKSRRKNVYEPAKNQAEPDLLCEKFAREQADLADKYPEVAADTDFMALLKLISGSKANIAKRLRVELNKNVAEFGVTDDERDMELCTPAGTYDLTTGRLVKKDNGLTMVCTAVAPDMDPEHFEKSNWKKFLEEDIPEKEMRDYLQIAIGASLYGSWPTQSPILHMWSGVAGAGKSEIFNNIAAACGSYAAPQIDIKIFTTTMSDTQRAHERARLVGKRIGITSELDQAAWLSDDTLKLIVSNDPIRAEEKYQRGYDFINKCSLHMVSNYLPQVKNIDDKAIRRRIRAGHFSKSFTLPNGQPNMEFITDINLPRKVRKEHDIILGWAMRGAVKFAQDNFLLNPPPVIEKATEDYFGDYDWLTSFLNSECDFDAGQMVPLTSLFMRFQKWADLNGERFYNVNSRLMAQKLRLRYPQLGIERYHGKGCNGSKMVFGLSLKENTEAALAISKQIYGDSSQAFQANREAPQNDEKTADTAPLTPSPDVSDTSDKNYRVIKEEPVKENKPIPPEFEYQTSIGKGKYDTGGGYEAKRIKEAVKSGDRAAMVAAPISPSGIAFLAQLLTNWAFSPDDIWAVDWDLDLRLTGCPEEVREIVIEAARGNKEHRQIAVRFK